MKDVADYYELKRYILANDLEHIAMTLLTISAPKGVAYRTYCLADKCSHSEVMIIDPAGMVLTLEESMSEIINPELRELAIQFPNTDEFKAKRREYLASLRGHEYMQ